MTRTIFGVPPGIVAILSIFIGWGMSMFGGFLWIDGGPAVPAAAIVVLGVLVAFLGAVYPERIAGVGNGDAA